MDRIVPSSVCWHWDSTASGNWGPLFKYQAVHDGLALYARIYSHSGEILLHVEASQNIHSQHHDHREAVRTRFIKHNIKTVKSTRSKWLMFLPAAKFTSTVMASTIVKYRSSLDIYQISVHIQCQILCEQCTCITNKVIIIKHVTLFTFHHWL